MSAAPHFLYLFSWTAIIEKSWEKTFLNEFAHNSLSRSKSLAVREIYILKNKTHCDKIFSISH